MTCEIAVMNKFGVALAADSAVTLGDGQKIYHHAQKLFPIRRDIPVAIMVYGNSEIMETPWEVIIRSYAQYLGLRTFRTVEEYAEAFFCFIESSDLLLPEAVQRDWFRSTVKAYWANQFIKPLDAKSNAREILTRKKNPTLTDLIRKDHRTWAHYPKIEPNGAEYAKAVLTEYAHELTAIEREVFGVHALTGTTRDGLRQSVGNMYARHWFHPNDQGHVVFVGMGDGELFPGLLVYKVGAMAAGRLRRVKSFETRVTRKDSAIVVPLAQSEMIDMFFRGIDPELDGKLDEIVKRSLRGGLGRGRKRLTKNESLAIGKEFRKALETEIREHHNAPLIDAVEALPRYDLAKMAEALVNLTAFRKRVSITQKETVGGSIDVAVLSKGGGFVWVQNDQAMRADVKAAA